jgi:hypothetical protein
MIWSTSYHHVTLLVYQSWPHLLFTIASVHRRQVLLKLHRPVVHRSKASDFPFTLATGPSSQASSWSSSPWSHDSMSCLICNELLHDTITCGLIPCVSHINTISSPKVVTQLPKPNKDISLGIKIIVSTLLILLVCIPQHKLVFTFLYIVLV